MIHHLDITEEHCPMTFVKTRLKLEEINQNDILEVLLKAGEPLDNLPKAVQEYGFHVLNIQQITDKIYKLFIKKV